MPASLVLLPSAAAQRLLRIAREHLAAVPVPRRSWRSMSDEELWRAVAVQVSVAGGSSGAERLRENLKVEAPAWYQELCRANPGNLYRIIHKRLQTAGVRFVPKDGATSQKSVALVRNLEILRDAGGPRSYFKAVASEPQEADRVRAVASRLHYVSHKGSRDLLIGLGLAKNVLAIDVRWKNVLDHVGARVPKNVQSSRRTYDAIEAELLQKVAAPLGITGAHLDRIIYGRYDKILPRRTGARENCTQAARERACCPSANAVNSSEDIIPS